MCEKTKKRKRVMCKKIHTIVYVKTEIVKMSHAHSKTHVNLWGKSNSVSAMEVLKMSHAHSKTHVNLWGKNNSVSAMGDVESMVGSSVIFCHRQLCDVTVY